MLKYLSKRMLHSLVTVIIVSFLIFALLRLMPTTGYFTRNDYERLSESQREMYLEEIGVKGNVFLNYGKFVLNTTKGDLGDSITVSPGTPVSSIIGEKAGYSISFGLAGVALSLVMGVFLGTLMAQYKDTIIDHIGTFYVVFVRSVPNLIYLFMIQIFVTKWLNLPTQFVETDPRTWFLPVFSIALVSSANYAIWIRRFMVDEKTKDYVRFNTSKGISDTRNFYGHIFRNAVTPIAQRIPVEILLTIAGFLVVENLYGIPGMGRLLVTAIQRQDNNLVQVLVLIFSVLGVVGIMLGDVLMTLIDPRIKLSKEE
ncbi:ABC transporter permease [Acidaminobacter sp. JC074]|uniref:ABC transporter permease n=1 Tax=Acidaminobacter sp. JC074 TaxID=2530199 RepID=UPI001F0FEC4A|nr:ABC transporter permease [Acidaminobacter sp. JC074]MCH4890869.1 ABC transporter permease [Acidaminobacter sp. JC074]